MYDNRLKLREGGGVAWCCIKTLAEYEGNGDKEHERYNGTVLPCKLCSGALIIRDRAWEWHKEYKK